MRFYFLHILETHQNRNIEIWASWLSDQPEILLPLECNLVNMVVEDEL